MLAARGKSGFAADVAADIEVDVVDIVKPREDGEAKSQVVEWGEESGKL